jgi:hypothetical protein
MELTGRRGISMLNLRGKVWSLVRDSEYDDATKLIVSNVMDEWLALADHVHAVSIICNDQKKQDAAKIAEYIHHVAAFVKLWIPFIGGYKNWQYHKLHSLMCGAFAFIKKYGMLGRGNAQGFENKHFEKRRLNDVMGKIPNRKVRVQKLAQRSQSTFIEGLPESLNFLEQADKDGKCCVPYVFYLCAWCACVCLFLTAVHSYLLLSFSFFLSKKWTSGQVQCHC